MRMRRMRLTTTTAAVSLVAWLLRDYSLSKKPLMFEVIMSRVAVGDGAKLHYYRWSTTEK